MTFTVSWPMAPSLRWMGARCGQGWGLQGGGEQSENEIIRRSAEAGRARVAERRTRVGTAQAGKRGQAQGDNREERVSEQPEQDVRGVSARKHMRGSRRAKDAAAHAVGREGEDGGMDRVHSRKRR